MVGISAERAFPVSSKTISDQMLLAGGMKELWPLSRAVIGGGEGAVERTDRALAPEPFSETREAGGGSLSSSESSESWADSVL